MYKHTMFSYISVFKFLKLAIPTKYYERFKIGPFFMGHFDAVFEYWDN